MLFPRLRENLIESLTMTNIKKAQEAMDELAQCIAEKTPKLKFTVDLAINPHTGKYVLECIYETGPALIEAMTNTPPRYKEFLINITQTNKLKNEQ